MRCFTIRSLQDTPIEMGKESHKKKRSDERLGRKLGEKSVREAKGHWRHVAIVSKVAVRSRRMRMENWPLALVARNHCPPPRGDTFG